MAGRIFLAALLCFAVLSSPVVCDEATTVDSEEVTTTEPTPQVLQPAEIMKKVYDTVMKELENTSTPWVSGAVAIVLGSTMLFFGNFCFKYIVFCGVGICVFGLSTIAMSARLQAGFPMFVLYIVAAGVAGIFMYAAHQGYDGVLVLIGAFVGVLGYCGTHFVLSEISESGADGWIFFLVFGTMWVALGVYVFKTDLHMKAIALLSAFVGSFLLSSTVAFFVAFFSKGEDECPAWIDFAAMLANPTSEPVGAYPRWVSYLLWLFLFSVGSWVQLNYVTKYFFVIELFYKKDFDNDKTISSTEVLEAIKCEENVKAHFGQQGFTPADIEKNFQAAVEQIVLSEDGKFSMWELLDFYIKITNKDTRAREKHPFRARLLEPA